MIKNDKQLAITKEKVQQFRKAIDELEARKQEVSKIVFDIQLKGLVGQLKSLEKEIEDYLSIKEGNLFISESLSLDNVYQVLIKARIAQKITQAELAEKLGMAQQQIQRYEATNYESASLATIVNVCYALGVPLKLERVCFFKQTFELPAEITEESVEQKAKKIKETGSLFSFYK